MTTPCNPTHTANSLIDWLRAYAPLQIDSVAIDEQGAFPPHVLLDIGNQGFFGLHISKKYGGLELKTSDILRVLEQVAAIDLTLALMIIESIQGAHTLENYATDSVKNRYLPQLAIGRIFMAGALTESEAGSNPRAMKSVAVAHAEQGWVLKGQKRWVGMGGSAALIAVYVHHLDTHNQWQGISGFLVPQGAEGLRIGAESRTMGLRGFAKNTIHLENIKISPDLLLGRSGEGMEIAQDNMMYIRLCIAAACVGTMKRCIQLMFRYAERRIIATGQLIDNPITLLHLGKKTAMIEALDNFTRIIAHHYDHDPATVPEEAFVIAKILSSESLNKVVDTLMQLLGTRGYEEGSGISKIYRDARAFRILEGPTEALNMYLGSRALEKNSMLETFVCQTLKQKPLFHTITDAIQQVSHYCLLGKQALFDQPFSSNYWTQALVGEILSYGVVLGTLNDASTRHASPDLQRSILWAEHHFNLAIQTATTCSLEEKLLVSSDKLREYASQYADTIGNVDQLRQTEDKSIDVLLKFNQDLDFSQDNHFLRKNFATIKLNYNLYPKHTSAIVTETERHELLHRWHRVKKTDITLNQNVQQLFASQVLKTPNSNAVVFDNQHITYLELDRQSTVIASQLQKEGITANKLVALYCERSIDMIVGLLGILKSGGAYLPLDYNYPDSTLRFLFENSGAELVLSQKKLNEFIPFDAKKVVLIDDILADTSPTLCTIDTQYHPDDLGYVIYTSGSTGQPKGVMMPQKALSNLINWYLDKNNTPKNTLQFTTLNFDMSFIEIFSTLSTGGTLTLISEQDRVDLFSFAKIIDKHAIQQLVISVPFLKNLAEMKLDSHYFKTLDSIIVAGEQLIITPSILEFFNQFDSCRLMNCYGPSETHVVTAYEFPEKTTHWPDYAPIGQNIYNTKILLLDEKKRLVPFGATGEIYIGGASLANGYINRDDLTAERFIIDPWGDNPGDCLYKTGDFGKYLPDGNLVFLGRKDEQIKIRGFRIEPQEIEWHLLKFPNIKEAVVIPKTNVFSEKHLEAFLVVNSEKNDNLINDIYLFLQDHLPPHMLPSRFNFIDKMPLTGSGKINRKALETYESSATYTLDNIVPPETQTEKEVITLFEGMFKVKMGINNSFISIGGSSLLAMQAVSLLQKKFAIQMPAYSILSDPTLAQTAKRIDQLKQNMSQPQLEVETN